MKKLLIFLLLLLVSTLVFSQEDDDFFSEDMDFEDMDFDEMFGEEGDDEFLEVVEDQSDEIAEPSSELLTTVGVEWGGSFSSSLSAGLSYSEMPGFEDLVDDDKYNETFSPNLAASMHFNARPTDSTRFFGKFSTEIPFYKSADVLLVNENYDPAATVIDGNVIYSSDPTEGTPATVGIPIINIDELFTDFNYESKLFFRVGKQNAKWGVGYFFSPADFLSLESIDPENPEADREGPIAIKMSMPFGLNNLYTYITVPNAILDDPTDASVSDLIIAPMFQMLVGDAEVSTGIYYQKDSSPRGMLSGTYGTNTNYGQFSFFGEAVGLYGSDKTFIEDDYTTTTYDDKFFFNGTAGFMWSKDILENSFRFIGQYYYNGEGYDKESDVVKNVMGAFTGDLSGIPMEYMVNVMGLSSSGLGFNDLMNRDKHYLGLNLSVSNLFDNEDLSISAFSMLNLVDVSGFIKPTISYSLFDDLSVAFGTTINVSDEGDEYYADKFAFDLTVNLGGGSF